MATAQSKLDILIEAKRQGQGFSQAKADLQGLDQAAGNLSKGLGGIAAGVGVAGIVALGAAAAGAGAELARSAASAERLGIAYEGLAVKAGQVGNDMLASMRNAAQGTISDTDLMLAANKAMLLGVADSAEEMTGLLEIASARGKAMGLSTAQAFNDIVTGLGRGSALILDNLGITVDLEKTYRDYAATLGVTASQLTAAQQKQALLNEVIASSTDIVAANKAAGDDAASNYERMDAAISNAKVALGDLFSPAVAAIAQSIADAAVAATEGMKEYADATSVAGQNQELLKINSEVLISQITNQRQLMAELAAAGQQDSATYKELQAEVARLTQQLQENGAKMEFVASAAQVADEKTRGLTGILPLSAAALAQQAAAAQQAAYALQVVGMQAQITQEQFAMLVGQSTAISNMIDQAGKSAGVLFGSEQGGDAGLARQKSVTAELQAQKQAWRDMGYEEKEIAEVLMPAYIQNLQRADQSLFSAATSTATLSDEAKAANRAFEDLKSSVAGVLSGALDTGTGVNPDDVLAKLGLPREDAINESARRLADIAANGLKGQDWLGDFANDVPDIWRMIRTAQNPQEEAAYLLRDFQDGLLTAAIDKDKAKAIVKRQIMGDQNMAAMAQEIASELAQEMGIPLQEALAAAQGTLGGGGGTGAVGTGAAKSFNDGAAQGMEETNGGGVMVDSFIAQARASYSKILTAGRDAGKEWGNGFLAVVGENVPPALINLLTTLVTPQVMAQFAQKGTLTGANP